MVAVSAVLEGELQQLWNGNMHGIAAPAFPVNYYRFTLYDSSTVQRFTLSNNIDSTSCPLDQLQMVVSDTVQYPDPSDPATFNYTTRPVQPAGGVVDFTIVLSNSTQPAGSLRAGYYYVAVRSAVNASCGFWLMAFNSRPATLLLGGHTARTYVSADMPVYLSLAAMPYNTATSFAIQLDSNKGTTALYVGINNIPVSADPSTYLFVVAYNSTRDNQTDFGRYIAPPITIPASACSASSGAQLGQPRTVTLLALSDTLSTMLVMPMAYAGTVSLLPN